MRLRSTPALLIVAVFLTACTSTDPDRLPCDGANNDVSFSEVWVDADTLAPGGLAVFFEAGQEIADCDVRVELGEPAEALVPTVWIDHARMYVDLHLTDTSRSGPLSVWYADRLVLDTTVVLVRELPLEGDAYFRRRLTWEELQPVPADIENVYLYNPFRIDSIHPVEVDSQGILFPPSLPTNGGFLRAYSPSTTVVYTTDYLAVAPPPMSAERTGNTVRIGLGNSEWRPDEGVILHLDNNYPQGKSYKLPLTGNSASGEIVPGSYSVSCYSQEAGIYFELGNLLVP